MNVDSAALGDHTSYPIYVKLSDIETPSAITERKGDHLAAEVEAKYLLGCDGAHSWVRKQLGLCMQGDSLDEQWGVLDMIPITNFREFF